MVHAYRRGPDGAMLDLDEPPAPPHNDLGGFEAWRQLVWGSPAARALGLTLLPTLAETDVFAEGDELDQLDHEIGTMLGHLSAFGVDEDSLRFRLEASLRPTRALPPRGDARASRSRRPRAGLREAIRLARRVDAGGVCIG